MSKFLYDYTICKKTDNKEFYSACEKIEGLVHDIRVKNELLIDVDGSFIQVYETPRGKITVFNDFDVDAVYIKSEFELIELGYQQLN